MDETPSTTINDRRRGSSFWLWLGAAIVIATALALIIANTPPRIRLIGLLPIAFGLAIGWILPLLAEKLDYHPSRRMIGTVAAIVSLTGLIGCTWETVRLDELRTNAAIAEKLIEQLKQANGGATALGMINVKPAPPMSLAVFRRHLSRRLHQLGDWVSPWPEVFWGGELCAAMAASVWVSTRRAPAKAMP